MTAKLLEMKSKAQLWSAVFRGRKPETPKYNAKEFTEMFNGFQTQIDRRQQVLSQQQQPTKAVNHEGGTGAVANRKPPTESANEGAAQSSSAPFTYPGDPGPEPLAEAVTKEDL